VRGKEIVDGNIFSELQDRLKVDVAFKPLQPILQKVSNATGHFVTSDILNGIKAARWCYDHQLYQQGITILRETLVSMACRELDLSEYDYPFGRQPVETAFNCSLRKKEKWVIKVKPEELEMWTKRIEEYIQCSTIQQFAKTYNDLNSQFRNDIAHGGFASNAKLASEINNALLKHLVAVEAKLNLQ
jgi:hypothetical protein